MNKFLCFIGLHNWKYVTKRGHFPKIIKVYHKCINCDKRKVLLR